MDFDKVFGLDLSEVKSKKIIIPAEISRLAKEREKYRKEKNFSKADDIRKKIKKLGWLVGDTSEGPNLLKLK